MSDTTLCSAAENHTTKGESNARDPLVLVLRGWSVLGVTLCHALREGMSCSVCSRDVTRSVPLPQKTAPSRHTLTTVHSTHRHPSLPPSLPPFLPFHLSPFPPLLPSFFFSLLSSSLFFLLLSSFFFFQPFWLKAQGDIAHACSSGFCLRW